MLSLQYLFIYLLLVKVRNCFSSEQKNMVLQANFQTLFDHREFFQKKALCNKKINTSYIFVNSFKISSLQTV